MDRSRSNKTPDRRTLGGKVALVTGGARGLGLEISRQLAQRGATVVVAARSEDMARSLTTRLKAEGYEARSLKLDINREEDRVAAFDVLDRNQGRLDILINNAAVFLDSESAEIPSPTLASGTPETILRATFETNFFATVLLTQMLLPLVRRAPAGRIVNISSIRGSLMLQTDPSSGNYPKALAYDASKTALNVFTVQLAAELQDTDIKVNAVHPGWVRTEMGGDSAEMTVEEGARSAVLYASLGPDGPTGGFFHLDRRLPW